MGIKFLDASGESNAGRKRKNNEDNFLICRHPSRPALLAVVADGIGGHAHGEVASRICCTDMLHAALQNSDAGWDDDFLKNTLCAVNRKIFDCNFNEKRPYPSGTTVVAAVFTPETVIAASAGDSRLYEFDPQTNELLQLTVDHKPDQKLIDKIKKVCPDISEKKLNGMVMRSLGSKHYPELDIIKTAFHPGHSYMLCSDGLYCRLNDEKLRQYFNGAGNARQLNDKLMRAALLSGSSDNITIICCTPIQEAV